MHEAERRPFQGVDIRDVNIKKALSVPETDGTEIVVCLHTMDGSEVCNFPIIFNPFLSFTESKPCLLGCL